MPIQVKRMIPSTQIRKGEEFTYDGKTYVALTVDVKQKYTHVTYGEDARSLRILIDHQVEVTREELTEEESAQKQHDYALRWCQTAFTQAHANVDKYRAELVADLDKEKLDPSWTLRNCAHFAEAKHLREIWLEVRDVAIVEDIDLVEAVRIIRARIQRNLLNHLRLTSGSTSAVANLADAIKDEVQLDWVRRLEYVVD